jgi:hypothetical protein
VNSFLITFKPDTESPRLGWSLKSVQNLARQLLRGGRITDPWRFRNRKDVEPGDRVFLLMQGKNGPALIGSGIAGERNGVDEGRSWRDINFERLVDPAIRVLAGKADLRAIRGAEPWLQVQTSGVLLPRRIAAKMESLVVRGGFASRGRSRDIAVDTLTDAEEGDLRLRKHYTRERSRSLVSRKIEETLEKYGRLECEVCNSDLGHVYGDWGNKAIECHHKIPLASATGARKTFLEDLALICANCHRVLHGGKYDITSLRAVLNQMRRYKRSSTKATTQRPLEKGLGA